MSRSETWDELVRVGAMESVREVIAAYEAATVSGDFLSLAMPIVRLRAHVWRLDGVITEADDRPSLRGRVEP